jgi:hypothetical protein
MEHYDIHAPIKTRDGYVLEYCNFLMKNSAQRLLYKDLVLFFHSLLVGVVSSSKEQFSKKIDISWLEGKRTFNKPETLDDIFLNHLLAKEEYAFLQHELKIVDENLKFIDVPDNKSAIFLWFSLLDEYQLRRNSHVRDPRALVAKKFGFTYDRTHTIGKRAENKFGALIKKHLKEAQRKHSQTVS